MLSATVQLPDRYRVEDRIGAGAMGIVYRAWDQRLNRAVAIKVLNAEMSLDPQTSQRFLQEARAMAALSHPNIVTLFDVGVEGETPYMVMEYLQGSHLRDVLGDLPHLPEADVLFYGSQVADALATVHQHRLIHRDVKPENILLLEGTRRVKLMDFGIAHVLQSQKVKGTRPSGTPYYMSPEQITGGELGPWTDLYGLGATLFALLTGSLPFPEGEPLYHAVHTQAPSPQEYVPSLSSGTAALILSCLAKDPRKRPQSATIMATRLRSLAGVEMQEPTKG
jgi:serine/threonine-protein kinase